MGNSLSLPGDLLILFIGIDRCFCSLFVVDHLIIVVDDLRRQTIAGTR
jgi:hypothetical protein